MSGRPDSGKFCCVCGADETDESVVSGFLMFPAVTPKSALAVRYMCDACLAMLLAVVLQRISGLGSMLAREAIEAQDAEQG